MESVELSEFVPDFEAAVGRVAETGERVRITDGGEPARVLLAAGELAELEHFAQRAGDYGTLPRIRPRPTDERWRPFGPEEQGPYTRFVHSDGVRMTFRRGHEVVAELKSAAECAWVDERARLGRQGYMSPKQAAAFEEFLARRPPVGDGIAWIAESWLGDEPFSVLDFVKGREPEEVALAYGADPGDLAAGLMLHEVRERDLRDGAGEFMRVLAFGGVGEWTWLGYLSDDCGGRLTPPPAEQVKLVSCACQAKYDFRYCRDGEYQGPYPTEDDLGPPSSAYQINWYTPGEMPFVPDAPLGFLNVHIRRAEELTHWTDPVELFFAGLERALGLALPRQNLTTGHVRCARLTA
ncbi:type II toxin-antitoxin system Phd/YefM family antitoxin [Streptomyces sp. CMB-StM0423]|uniref:type II toxin-antitoxin system Phd/YefM family antitoxin n=1 Tax=Streptomyces sp. CMB-StM0423 TaxID=2059884 RepID=UPI000C7158F0|nr:type II toxin-antitoxin system Phd/YefM family antitoxin [Streptomyces sp. CMB-StM0423]AUH43686.1 prevent-host-death family protein [Streptomyces sp. CMB-StM0423]